MKTSRFFYLLLLAVVLLSGWAWSVFSYPRFASVDLSVQRPQALSIASDYLRSVEKVNPTEYLNAITFSFDASADRYLQKSIGFKSEEDFIREHGLDMYVWLVRFMKEGKKEEYRVAVSSKTGEVISAGHLLEDAAARPVTDEAAAQKIAEDFLRRQFNIDFSRYEIHSKSAAKFDNRKEYTFNWEKKGVFILWNADPASGGARLLTSVSVSGNEILSFSKQLLSPPDQFSRDIESKKEIGRNLGLVSSIMSLVFLIGAIWTVVQRRNHLTMHVTKRFYIGVMGFLFVTAVLSGLNTLQAYMMEYPTTQPMVPYFIRQIINDTLGQLFLITCFIVPCLAGELLHFEVFPKKPEGGFFYYLTTTFLSRNVARTLFLGYAFAGIMIGLQSVIFEFGFRYLGVWIEQTRLNQLSSGYFPFLTALVIGSNASFVEETLYRLFGISFGVKVFKRLWIAAFVSSLVWGLGHTGYVVFPFWFRGFEVTLLGIFLSLVYLRFGIICTIVVHFLFDAFWASAPFIFGRSDAMNFTMSLVVLALPLMWAVAAFLTNRPVVQKNLEWRLNAAQKFNMEILKGFILRKRAEPSFSPEALHNELIRHGWDIAVIDVAFKQLNIPAPGDNHWHSA